MVTTGIMTYLDGALEILDRYGLAKKEAGSSRMAELLSHGTAGLDQGKVMAVARVLGYQDTFEDVARANIEEMNTSDRYRKIGNAFTSVIEDSTRMKEQLADGKIDTWEKFTNIVRGFTHGSIEERFETVRKTYEEVSADVKEQIQREQEIISAYTQYSFAFVEAMGKAQELAQDQKERLQSAKAAFSIAAEEFDNYQGGVESEKTPLRLQRAQAEEHFKKEDRVYQLTRVVADNMAIAMGIGEGLKTGLQQTNEIKQRGYMQLVTFYTTNKSSFVMMSANLTALKGLHESTETIEALKEGTKKTLEHLAGFGTELKEKAARTAHGPTVMASDIKNFLDASTALQKSLYKIADEGRAASEENGLKVIQYVDDAQKERAQLVTDYVAGRLESDTKALTAK